MTIGEISSLNFIMGSSPTDPFVVQFLPGKIQLAEFWTDVLGAKDESRDFTILVKSFIRAFEVKYNEVTSYEDCVSQEGSFLWDNAGQILYVHFEHNQSENTDTYQYGTFFGVSDNRLVYIDNNEYLPLISSSPSIAQQQDIVNYNQLSFISGALVLNNLNNETLQGQLDFFINADLYNNDVFLYYLDDADVDEFDNASRSDLIYQAAFYIEDYDISLKEISVDLQDKRKAQNISIPKEKFNTTDYPDIGDESGTVIPLMYGQVREAKAIKTNSETTTGNVSYRVSLLLTILGTVQVDIDGIWTTVPTASVSLSSGEFELSAANGRNTNGSVRDCRVLLPTGIEITHTSDIIIDLNNRFIGLDFLPSNYNVSEWTVEQTLLSSGGWVFDSEVKLYEAIRIVQSGSSVGFRYEISPDGRRTIRVDNPARTVSGRVEPVDILNRDTMPVKTDSSLVFAEIELAYSKSFNSGRFLRETNSDFSDSVLSRYKQLNTLPTETILNTKEDAEAAALDKANRFKNIPEIMTLELMGKNFLPLRIFDILDLEATPDFADVDNNVIIGREYFGFRRGKVINISPNTKNGSNKVDFLLLDKSIPDSGIASGSVYGLGVYGIDSYGG